MKVTGAAVAAMSMIPAAAATQPLAQTTPLSFMNMPILTYIAEISPRPVLFIYGEEAHSRYFAETALAAAAEPKELLIIPDASHTDLYDRMDKIPFDRIAEFFGQHLA